MGTAALIASLLAGIVQGVPQISAEIKSIVTAIAVSQSAVLSSGVTTNISPTTILTALAGVIAYLKGIKDLPASTLQAISDLDQAAAAALVADQQAQKAVDPTQLQPITPIP